MIWAYVVVWLSFIFGSQLFKVEKKIIGLTINKVGTNCNIRLPTHIFLKAVPKKNISIITYYFSVAYTR